MGWAELRAAGDRLLAEARALRVAFLDATDARGVTFAAVPDEPFDDACAAALRAALGYLRDEMLLVRDGKAGGLIVLDDEVACVEALLARS